MTMYQDGYRYYVEQCIKFGLQPLSIRYYAKRLSTSQLQLFNDFAKTKQLEA